MEDFLISLTKYAVLALILGAGLWLVIGTIVGTVLWIKDLILWNRK